MPGGDRTGPNGFGPLTGRGAGYCAGYHVPGFTNPINGYGVFGRGFGRGLGRGIGRGRGFRHIHYGAGYLGLQRYPIGYQSWGGPANPNFAYSPETIAPGQEAEMLREQMKYMQDNLNAINERIRELEQLEKEKEKPAQ